MLNKIGTIKNNTWLIFQCREWKLRLFDVTFHNNRSELRFKIFQIKQA